jgi:pimeloyl-ACP methyl ester carboxylesterase
MELKLSQRIALKYYRTKLKTLESISNKLAAKSALKLFCTPYNQKKKLIIPTIFQQAKSISFELDFIKINGFEWNNTAEKKVLILHGFDSSSYKFEKYIKEFIDLHYHVVVFDAPAHGISEGKNINALLYSRCIIKANELYGNFTVFIAHSLGGLALSLALEKMNAHQTKSILIAPATETGTALEHFFKFIPLKPKTIIEFHQLIQNLSGNSVSWFSIPRALQNTTSQVLWIHDRQDLICPIKDVENAMNKKLQHVTFHITNGLGHNKIYRDSKVVKEIIDFVSLN